MSLFMGQTGEQQGGLIGLQHEQQPYHDGLMDEDGWLGFRGRQVVARWATSNHYHHALLPYHVLQDAQGCVGERE